METGSPFMPDGQNEGVPRLGLLSERPMRSRPFHSIVHSAERRKGEKL
ncbi:MAG: hypothetical protein M3494_14685 [Actinomycetota bacterium]|nr:hypothetical protein [Rubrobacter sp.]MDQ3509236.1 hypothetical protein [Actinomycetota bacterium]